MLDHFLSFILHTQILRQMWIGAVASGGEGVVGKGGSCPSGPVEPDTLSLWMDLFFLDSVIYF